MKWSGRDRSTNVEDRRGGGGRRGAVAGGGILTLIIIVVSLIMGENPLNYINQSIPGTNEPTLNSTPTQYDEEAAFVSVVLKDTEDIWTKIFAENGYTYRPPTLVLYSGTDQSGCGTASAAVGPFYCSQDERVYIDLSFTELLRTKLGADGDFALAYVIAHEVGHHVQHLLGTLEAVGQAQRNSTESRANQLSVKLELQADFYAGIWAHYAESTKDILEPGDIEEGLNAAKAVGDDKLQMESQGYVVPESFTHGTSAQRMEWFIRGYKGGEISEGLIK